MFGLIPLNHELLERAQQVVGCMKKIFLAAHRDWNWSEPGPVLASREAEVTKRNSHPQILGRIWWICTLTWDFPTNNPKEKTTRRRTGPSVGRLVPTREVAAECPGGR